MMTYKPVNLELLVPISPVMRLRGDAVKDEEFIKSLQRHGVRVPLLVRSHPNPDLRAGGKFEIIDGNRRANFAIIAGLTHVPCEIRDMDDLEAYTIAIVRNVQRSDPDGLSIGNWLWMMRMKFPKLTQQDLADRVGKSQTWVSRHLALMEEAIEKGTPNVKTERAARALRGAPQEVRTRLLDEATQTGELPSAREIERRSRATVTPEEVLGRYDRKNPSIEDNFLIYTLQEEAGILVDEARKLIARWRRGGYYEKVPKTRMPRSDNRQVQIFAELTKYFPSEVIDCVSKVTQATTLETWIKNCRRFVAKLFEKTPETLRQAVLEEFRR